MLEITIPLYVSPGSVFLIGLALYLYFGALIVRLIVTFWDIIPFA